MILYAIKTAHGQIAAPTTNTSKRKCISEYMARPGNRSVTWRQLRRWGWSCVRVRLIVLEEPSHEA